MPSGGGHPPGRASENSRPRRYAGRICRAEMRYSTGSALILGARARRSDIQRSSRPSCSAREVPACRTNCRVIHTVCILIFVSLAPFDATSLVRECSSEWMVCDAINIVGVIISHLDWCCLRFGRIGVSAAVTIMCMQKRQQVIFART